MAQTFRIQLPTTTEPIDYSLENGSSIFVLGANGTGKSSLMHRIYSLNRDNCVRIFAHRRTWFTSNTIDITPAQKIQTEGYIKTNDTKAESRYKDNYAQQRASISIFGLINSENTRARGITKAVDEDDLENAKSLAVKNSPLNDINELLALSNLPIKISLGEGELLLASKNGSENYSIAELSDGERNALLIASEVLIAKPGSLILLDEPERHLHRSIISPLLTSLINKRPDCGFVISTHDINIPMDYKASDILLLRECFWLGQNISNWDADIFSSNYDIPYEVKRSILGSKRTMLFVEGDESSLDVQIYQLIYPQISVIPKGNCREVQNAVDGIFNSENLHWIDAYGLIDADDRPMNQIESLLEKNIVATDCYSVESLYYDTDIIKKVAEVYSEITEKNADEIFENAINTIIPTISQHKDRMCARMCEKKSRTELMKNFPTHRDILINDNCSWILRIKLRQSFRSHCASDFGSICATLARV
ncbi:DUF4435 domain-containing protein [Salegentibacter agarivorans]